MKIELAKADGLDGRRSEWEEGSRLSTDAWLGRADVRESAQ